MADNPDPYGPDDPDDPSDVIRDRDRRGERAESDPDVEGPLPPEFHPLTETLWD